ncbi:amidase [Aurantimonas sp. MSK8Z-1]|uniref:amidase n=1 Tax=Mangrovibrevibacter kandeliae TaxID=2968473 RepID=UPI002119A041|nr:amidase [Aurantimonas sp. MSK8Z-1]MCW4115715.1 amidase [Aurantimonas sp. MSK8Z-1]
MTDDHLAFLDIGTLGAMLRRAELSPVELTELALDRLERVGRPLNAVASLMPETARREARLAEAELRAGLDRGPLHGIPYGLKDIVAATGAPTTWGARPFAAQQFDEEATVTRKLRDAGAILVAKLATIELAGGMGYDHPDASLSGPPANPWDPTRWTNGSSSGPAAAVAAGLVPFAIGSDTGGSILLPAAFTGTAGLRATFGRVSRFGAMTLCWTLDRLGPLCRSARDCGLVLEAITGLDPRDPTTLAAPWAFRPDSARQNGFRFGVIASAMEQADAEVRSAFEASLEVLKSLGTVEFVSLPELPYADVTNIVVSAEVYAAFDDFIASGRTVELTAAKAHAHRIAAAVLPAHDYIRAQRIRAIIAAQFGALACGYDALLAPTLGTVASHVDRTFEYMLPRDAGRPLNLAGVLSGSPTISVFNGFGRDGLPTGLQFAGAPFRETAILAAAMAFEAHTSWHSLHPALGEVAPPEPNRPEEART